MKCLRCDAPLELSPAESSLSRRIYRCTRCGHRFQYITATGRLVELATVTGAIGALIGIAISVLLGG